MQLVFQATLYAVSGAYTWYDSGDASVSHLPRTNRPRPRTKAAQRRLSERVTKEVLDAPRFDPFTSAPNLFHEFADLDGSEASVLAFTNRYGRLWNEGSDPSLAAYQETIEELHDAIELWQAVRDHNTSRLKRFVEWTESGRLMWKNALAEPVKREETVWHVGSRMKRKKGDIVGPGTDLLDFVIYTRSTWAMQVKPYRRDGIMSLIIEVPDLLNVLWIQFALAVANDKTFVRCQFCNRAFEHAPQINRADRLFCSDNCRVKAYQRRRKQAIGLRQQGKSMREIASATDSKLNTVKEWMSDFEAKEKTK